MMEQIDNNIKCTFMLRDAHKDHPDGVKVDLKNRYAIKKKDAYPSSTAKLLSMLNNFQTPAPTPSA